jgi:hypothetical protein
MRAMPLATTKTDLLSVNPETWDSLAQTIGTIWPLTIQYAKRAAQGGLKVGDMITTFAARPEIQAELEEANRDRPDRKFTPVGFVADKLSEKYGNKLPGVKHLRDCARAATVIQSGGSSECGIRALLGWDGEENEKFPEVMIPKLPLPKGAKGKEPRKKAIEIALHHFKRIEASLQELLASGAKLKFKGEDWERYQEQIENVNRYLKQLGLEIIGSK